LKRGSSSGIVDFQDTINRDIAEHNNRSKLFVWTEPAGHLEEPRNYGVWPSI
jgi:hypothetical protein